MSFAKSFLSSIITLVGNKGTGAAVPEPPTDPYEVRFTRINFVEYGLPEYEHSTAFVIDNALTPEDCVRLLSLVPSSTSKDGDQWLEAKLDETFYDPTYRNSGRIVREDVETEEWLLQKIRPYLVEIEHVEGDKHVRWEPGRMARIQGFRSGLRFLRYTPGQFFKPHVDSTHISEDKKELSYFTIQVYLNGDKDTLRGGATRFHSSKRAKKSDWNGPGERFLDVEPRRGRVLVFEQKRLKHSGEDVVKGIKYNIRGDLMYVVDEDVNTQ
jgi:hypothetical protein